MGFGSLNYELFGNMLQCLGRPMEFKCIQISCSKVQLLENVQCSSCIWNMFIGKIRVCVYFHEELLYIFSNNPKKNMQHLISNLQFSIMAVIQLYEIFSYPRLYFYEKFVSPCFLPSYVAPTQLLSHEDVRLRIWLWWVSWPGIPPPPASRVHLPLPKLEISWKSVTM